MNKIKKKVLLASAALMISGVGVAHANNSIWTDWYKKGVIQGLLGLSEIRDNLFKNNLTDAYLTHPANRVCDAHDLIARSADGSCNDLKDTWMGAANTRFSRNVPLAQAFPDSRTGNLLTPDPRAVSLNLLTRKEFKPIDSLNLFTASWIQFMVHDWVSHGDNDTRYSSAFFLPLTPTDPFHQNFMTVFQTKQDETRTAEENQKLPPTYVNEISSWWDGSQVYGSDLAAQHALREMSGGRMKQDADGHLPVQADGVDATGFKRNWWIGLSMMHHLFITEHNKIAAMIAKKHPDFDDQKIFDTARLVNVAVMAKIHTVEWTPAVLNNPTLKQAMHANWFGVVNQAGNKTNPGWKSALESFHHNPLLHGLVGSQKELHGVPYSLTEEFTSVYRLHSLLPESLKIVGLADHKVKKDIPLADTRDQKSHLISHNYQLQDIAYSMGLAHPGQITLNNFPNFLQDIEMPIVGKMDIGAVDILRDRERGVPRYNRFRQLLGLNPISSFDDLTDDKAVVQKIRSIYGSDHGRDLVENLDLLIGTLAEGHRPDGFGFGETQFQIFILTASRRLQADRFFTTDYNAATYTQEGLDWVDGSTFKSVIVDAYPNLKPVLDKLPKDQSAFSAWSNR